MSDETQSSPEIPPSPEVASVPRARRVSTPRPKKAAKSESPEEATAQIPSIPFPSAPEPDDVSDAPSPAGNDWPEPEAESTGTQSQPEIGSKRKRRRRKGKGQSAGPLNGGGPSTEDVYTLATPESTKSTEAPHDQRPRPPQPQQQHRPKVDPELLTKMAWKIYLAEVSEEGVALIGDNDAKDLSRRCFRLAEIFIEEQTRRR
jgi:hypothetical protein